jgi:tRNA A37 threonylcarbamoyladenosine biosynthesis protein TsaE
LLPCYVSMLFSDSADLGAGKTTLARGFVFCKLGVDDARGGGQAIHVTSPTYLLSNTYCYMDDRSEQEHE